MQGWRSSYEAGSHDLRQQKRELSSPFCVRTGSSRCPTWRQRNASWYHSRTQPAAPWTFPRPRLPQKRYRCLLLPVYPDAAWWSAAGCCVLQEKTLPALKKRELSSLFCYPEYDRTEMKKACAPFRRRPSASATGADCHGPWIRIVPSEVPGATDRIIPFPQPHVPVPLPQSSHRLPGPQGP